jgi:PAS domain S-box-containing protein
MDRFFRMSADMLCVAGTDGFFLELNPAFERVLGYSLEELKQKPFIEYVHPDDQASTLAEVEKLSAGAVTLHFENRYRCKDGSYRWLQWTSQPDTKRGLLFAVARDVTESKEREERLRKAEEALRQSHNDLATRYQAVVRASGQLIYDLDSNDRSISHANPGNALGYIDEDLAGGFAHWVELIHPDDRTAFESGMQLTLDSGIPFSLEYRVQRNDGKYVHVADRGYPVADDSGRTLRVVGFIVDVSDRKKLEDQLRQAQKMEAVGTLAGGIAHDFNNLLTVICGYTELHLEQLEEGNPLRRDLEVVKMASDRATALTRQLLAFSRRQVLQPQVLNLNSVISEMEKMLRRLIREDIEFLTRLDPDVAHVLADPGQVEQVLMNLVVNARDAMPQGGRLLIETANAVLDDSYPRSHMGASKGPHVMLAVSDTGCGMDDGTKERAFEPFFTTKPQGEGTGLGLSTVYGIVKQSGGNIYAYSEPGSGTSIKVYLPQVLDSVVSTHERDAQASPPSGTETVLLVEDEDMVRVLAKRILEGCGYVVLDAPNGADALDVAEDHKGTIDLVLTDVTMPRMGGFELVKELLSVRPRIHSIYMSGYTDQGLTRQHELDPSFTFLQKPFTPASLARQVRKTLDEPYAGRPASPVNT